MRNRLEDRVAGTVALTIFGLAFSLCASLTGASAATIDLGEYVLDKNYSDIGSEQIDDSVIDNFSGITYNSSTNTLFSVLNAPEVIIEIDPQTGHVLREVTLTNFWDTEGIVHLGGNRFGIVEERRRNLVIINIGNSATSVDRTNTLVSTNIPLGDPDDNGRLANSGIEGVAYDPITDTVYVVWEKENPTIRSFDLSLAESSPNVTPAMSTPFSGSAVISPTTLAPFTDLAGLHFNAATNTLLILGEENKEIIEVDPVTGMVQAGSILLTGAQFMDQPEGITVGPDGTLYVAGEMDELLVFVGPDLSIPEPSAFLLCLASLVFGLRRRR